MTSPVSFPLAQTLKDKGFKQKERPSYLLVDYSLCNLYRTNPNNLQIGDLIGFYIPDKTVNAPTIGDVIMWLYEKYGVWIACDLDLSNSQLFEYKLQKENYLKLSEIYYNSPTEAYEAAIEYTLNNLL